MSESADSGPTAEDMHWAIHLREDMRDIRSEIRGVHTRIDALSTRLESHLRWTMMAMIAMTGVIAALVKL